MDISILSEQQKQNVKANFQYLCNSCTYSFQSSKYQQNQTFEGLDISLSTFKNLWYNAKFSNKTLEMIASTFSKYLVYKQNTGISCEDLLCSNKLFEEKYPSTGFRPQKINSPFDVIDIFTNVLYRCYYMLPSSPYSAYMGYLKLFKSGNHLSACMVKCIQDFDLEPIRNFPQNVDSLNHVKHFFIDNKDKLNSNKTTSSIHLYTANAEDIKISSECIQIDFKSDEEVPCHSTLFWNISICSKIRITSYIGGSALMVDTNDGTRGKDICSYKVGLEAFSPPLKIPTIDTEKPLNPASPQLIKELCISPQNGVTIIDNSDDSRWYRFLQEKTHRESTPNLLESIDIPELIHSLFQLKQDYTHELEHLRTFIDDLKK